jgi:HD superfamily phosphodiesterase
LWIPVSKFHTFLHRYHRMASNNDILTAASEYVGALLHENLPAWSVYHNYEHTLEVVEACEEIGKASKLSKEELEVVLLAAWFHDTGHVQQSAGHEEKSVEIAETFLRDHLYPEQRIEAVTAAILTTEVSARAKNLPQMVVRDADILHAGRKDFFAKSQLLRMEEEKRNGRVYTDLDWLNLNLDFLARCEFLTAYARSEYGPRRTKNLLGLREQIGAMERTIGEEKVRLQKKTNKEKEKTEKETRPDRGIETMFRTVPTHHLNLSSIADQKANIMLSSNALIISIVFGLLISKLDTNPHLMFPTFLLLAVCLTAIVFAILSTRPKVSSGTFTREDITKKRVNLLFFGNFHSVPFEDFSWGMKEMMNDRDYLYGSMIQDLYHLGKVLERKYRYLRICYTVFMYGLIASVIAFLISFLSTPGMKD